MSTVNSADINENKPDEMIAEATNSTGDFASSEKPNARAFLEDFRMSANSAEVDETNPDEKTAEVTNSTDDFATPEKQHARAFLRERFLRVITGIVGKPAKFQLYENTNVTAEFRGCDVDFMELYVRNLNTPLGVIPEAILRTNDVIVMEVDNV